MKRKLRGFLFVCLSLFMVCTILISLSFSKISVRATYNEELIYGDLNGAMKDIAIQKFPTPTQPPHLLCRVQVVLDFVLLRKLIRSTLT